MQRWEALGLPIIRPHHHLRSPVCASPSDIEAWLHGDGSGRIASSIHDNDEIAELRARIEKVETEAEHLKQQLRKLNDHIGLANQSAD